MFKLLPEPTNFNFRIDEIVWTSYTNNPGCSSSTTEQSILPVTADPSLERKEVLSNKCNFEQQLETGASMVDKKFGDIQWDFFSQTFSTSCAPDRYFIVRLESGSPGKINRLHMVISRKEIGTTRSKTSHPDISQESKIYFNSRTNEQHSGFDIFEKNWGNQESEIDYTVKRDLGNINFRTDYDCCGVPT